MSVIIGICGFEKNEYIGVPKKYIECIHKAGGTPLILFDDAMYTKEYLTIIDGVMFVGGGDISARYLFQEQHPKCTWIDENRDAFELLLCKEAYKNKVPILGICRGCQIINVALGGDIFQDIPNHMQVKPEYSHIISLSRNSILHRIFSKDRISVNSYHHQSCSMLAEGLRITAVSADGIIEAFESDVSYISAMQFHPERSTEQDNNFLYIFCDFINACIAHKKQYI